MCVLRCIQEKNHLYDSRQHYGGQEAKQCPVETHDYPQVARDLNTCGQYELGQNLQ